MRRRQKSMIQSGWRTRLRVLCKTSFLKGWHTHGFNLGKYYCSQEKTVEIFVICLDWLWLWEEKKKECLSWEVLTTAYTKCQPECGATGSHLHWWWECKSVWPLWKTVSYETKHNPAMMLLGIYPNKQKTYAHRKTCTPILIVALFIIAHTWKQPRLSSVGERIKELW